MTKSSIYSLILLAVVTASCDNDSKEPLSIGNELLTDKTLTLDARNSESVVKFSSSEKWSASSDAEWLTPTLLKGNGSSDLPLYIQQNDGGESRSGNITITFASGESLSVSITQLPSDENGTLSYIPQSYGVGWGYDASVDMGDVEGLRGQILDVAKLKTFTEDDYCIQFDDNPFTLYMCESENSTVELTHRLATKLTGEVDLKIAGAKVSAEFEKQTTETKNRYFLWYRNMYGLKECSLIYDVADPSLAPYVTTLDFKKAIYNLTPGQFVKKYGTHLIVDSSLGGKVDYYLTFSQDIKETVERITLTITVKFLCWKASSTSVNEKLWEDIKEDFTGRFYVAGGGAVGKQLNDALARSVNEGKPTMPDGGEFTLFDDWADCFRSDYGLSLDELAIVNIRVVPVYDIVSAINQQKGKAIEDYIKNTYLK